MHRFTSAVAVTFLSLGVLAGCLPGPPDKGMVTDKYLDILSDAGDLNSSARDDLNFLRRYEYYLVNRYQIVHPEQLGELYRQLWLREAVYQLRVAAHVIAAVGPDGNLELIVATLDSTQAHGLTIGRIVAESEINTEKIARDLRSQLWMYNPPQRYRLEYYIGIFEILDDIKLWRRRPTSNSATGNSA